MSGRNDYALTQENFAVREETDFGGTLKTKTTSVVQKTKRDKGYAWVTLATNDSYSLGALVLAHSLRKSKTVHKLAVLITPAVSQPMRDQLQTVFDVVKVVDVLDSKDEAHLALMQRPELGITFTKIHCWRLVEFDKCVFLDADTLVVRNCDELFEREEFSAAPDVSWPDCFNSGVFVYKPSVETFNNLLQFAVEKGSFDGGDQGLLNQFFSDWATEDIKKHLPFVYNLTSVAAYSYIPAFKHYGSETRIVHFIGAGKPWLQQLDPATRTITPTTGSEHLAPLLQQWWDLFCEKVHPNLDKNLESNNDGMSHPPVEACSNSLPVALTDDDSQTVRLIEPRTPYREKDDFRQCNLPYQPFDVRGSSGELLNVEFLLASVVHSAPSDVGSGEQQRREGDGEQRVEKTDGREDGNKEESERGDKRDSNATENENRKKTEGMQFDAKTNQDYRTEEKTNDGERTGEGEQKQEQPEQRELTQQPPPPTDPFDYESFFPDETCINNYLEQNVMTYQPYDHHHTYSPQNHEWHKHIPGENSPQHSSSSKNTPQHSDSNRNSPQHSDSSGHTPQHSNSNRSSLQHSDNSRNSPQHSSSNRNSPQHSDSSRNTPQHSNSNRNSPQHSDSIQKSPQQSDRSEDGSKHVNESATDTGVCSTGNPQRQDSPPSLPRFLTIPENDRRQSGNTETHPQKSEAESKSEPPRADPPRDPAEEEARPSPQKEKLEERRELIKSKSMPYLRFDVTEMPSSRSVWKSQPDVSVDPCRRYSMPKLKPILPRQNSLSRSVMVMPKVTLYTEFLMSSEYKDPADLPKDKVGFVETLIHKRGNLRRSKSAADIADRFGPLPYVSPETEQPTVLKKTPLRHLDNGLYDLSQCKRQMGNRPRSADRRKENSHLLPALKPLVPPKDKKSTLIKKRKSKELSPGDGGREKILKREPKKPKERKREFKVVPRNVSGAPGGNDVDEILKRLREFSKNYEHFFGEVPEPRKAADQRGDVAVRAGDRGDETASRGAHTGKEEKGERQGPSVESEFRQFRNYVKEKSKTSQKGLLSIQDLVSGSGTGEGDVAMGSKAPADLVGSKRGGERIRQRDVGDQQDGGVERKDKTEDVEEREKLDLAKKSFCRADKAAGKFKDNRRVPEMPILSSGDSAVAISNGTVDTPSRSSLAEESEKVETNDEISPVGVGSSLEDKSAESADSLRSEVESNSEPAIATGKEVPVVSSNGTEAQTDRREGGSSKVESSFEEVEGRDPKEDAKAKGIVEPENGVKTESSGSCLGGMTPNRSDHFEVVSKSSAKEEYLTPLGEPLEGGMPTDKLSTEKAAADGEDSPVVSSQGKMISEQNPVPERNRLKINGKFGGGKFKHGGDEDKPAFRFGKNAELHKRLKNPDEILCVPDFDTPRSSRVVVPTPTDVAAEVIEEIITKATLTGSQAWEQPLGSISRKSRKPVAGTAPGPPVANGAPNDPPAGEETSAVAKKHSSPPPSALRNGREPTQSEEDLKLRSGIAGAIAQLSLEAGSGESPESSKAASAAHQEYLRRQNWETGNMDYLGRDSFDNIWSKICQTLEGKEQEEAGPAAVSPKPVTDPPKPSAGVSAEEAKKPEQSPVPEAPASLSAVLQKCPEFIDTLPAEPAAGPVEDDEIIFSKPDNRPSCLTNITEEEEVGGEGSAPGRVKLSDILHPGASSGPRGSGGGDPAGGPGEREGGAAAAEGKAPAGKVAEDKEGGGGGVTSAGRSEKLTEKSEDGKDRAEGGKVECKTVAICQPLPSPDGGGKSSEKSGSEKKVEECTTVAIPSPPIVIPGAPSSEKDKPRPGQKDEKPTEEKLPPIPLPPPESPGVPVGEEPAAKTSRSDSPKDEGKPKKGVFTKILEMVGVAPKEKPESETSKSVFYVEGAAPSKESGESENAGAAEPEMQAPVVGIEAKETEVSGKTGEGGQPAEGKKPEEKVSPTQEEKGVSSEKPGESTPPKVEEVGSAAPPGPVAGEGKPDGKSKRSVKKPARNPSPKESKKPPADSIQVSSVKSKSPSPKLSLSQKPPETAVTMPTPPPQTDAPLRKNSGLLNVEDTILETPPVREAPREETARGKVSAEVEDIIEKAKSEAETRLEDRKDSGEGSDPISALKLMAGTGEGAQSPGARSPEVEELRVTSEEERMRHKGEVVTSKLSDQILKAIPPPRRKAISEASASTSAIPKPPPSPEVKPGPGEGKPKNPKPSSIPVPPPRNRGKPAQATPPPKGKGKK